MKQVDLKRRLTKNMWFDECRKALTADCYQSNNEEVTELYYVEMEVRPGEIDNLRDLVKRATHETS